MKLIYNKCMAQDYLYLFAHLHKSAGTSLRHHFEKSIPAKERLNFFPDSAGYAIYQFSPDEFFKTSHEFCQSLDDKKKRHLRFIYGHKIHWGLHRELQASKPYYFTFLRDPAKRIISLYNYYRGWYERELPLYKDKRIYHNRLLVNGGCPDFKTWFENKILVKDAKERAVKPLGLSTTTEYYQKLAYLEAGPLTDKKLKDFTNKFDFIGFTSTFNSDSLYLYHLWQVKRFFRSRNISTKYISLQANPELERYLREQLSDDYQLYHYALEWKQNWLGQHPEFTAIVTSMRDKQEAAWWHQLLFDWPANFHRFSSQLREWLPIYGITLDKFKLLISFSQF